LFRVVNANLPATLVPVNAGIPAGLGGLGIVGVPVAIANAVCNATEKRITDLPITLDRLL
jgi:xanthine dehydrogenase YagR molybdenum-binding subunit